MLSNTSRFLTYLVALLSGLVGALLFFSPEQLAPAFAWKVTAFMTMSIGAWCLGNAWLAYFAASRWHWGRVYPALIYLWAFGVGQSLVVYLFRAKLVLVHPVAWLYVVVLIVIVFAALAGVLSWWRSRPSRESSGPHTSSIQFLLLVGFILAVGYLGWYGVTAHLGAPGTNGGIFPEIMSLFTLRSFGVFYLALVAGATPLLLDRNLKPFLNYGFLAYGLIIFITSAAFAYIRLFDFTVRPGGMLYIGAYMAVGIAFLLFFRKHGTGASE